MRTLILSDIHLGNRHSNTALLTEVLERESFDRLILNGDTINSVNLRKLNGAHWAMLDRFRKLARGRELILIRGNHDHEGDHVPQFNLAASPVAANGVAASRLVASAVGNGSVNGNGARNGDDAVANAPAQEHGIGTFNVLPALLEVPMHEDYRLDVGGKPYVVLHGDRFDPTLNYPVVTEVACFCYQLTTKVNKKLAKWLKKKSKRWSGVLEFVRGKAVAHAQQEGLPGVITGHTHFAEDSFIDNVHYLNTGCWTEYPCSYITIDDGRVALNHPSE
jgi:UDP-2,3-diacylglucosamine pyrophosphatase LpxH